MCEVEVIQNPIIKLSLNLTEANYLQELLQNPYMYINQETEDEFGNSRDVLEPKEESEIRAKLYTTLKKVTHPLNPTVLR